MEKVDIIKALQGIERGLSSVRDSLSTAAASLNTAIIALNETNGIVKNALKKLTDPDPPLEEGPTVPKSGELKVPASERKDALGQVNIPGD